MGEKEREAFDMDEHVYSSHFIAFRRVDIFEFLLHCAAVMYNFLVSRMKKMPAEACPDGNV